VNQIPEFSMCLKKNAIDTYVEDPETPSVPENDSLLSVAEKDFVKDKLQEDSLEEVLR